ncbi:MAG TPA: CAP domain-containing protein [Gaiellales bacterium]|jgi:uncharacterized protein YkwD|nr:CAP domain-containing protein [Gaiellales bacterium]
MRRRNIVACTLVAFATFGAGSAQAARPLHLSTAERSLLTAINSARAAAGVAPLRATVSLTSAATWQSQVLAQAGILDHTSPDGSTLIDRLTRARWHGTAAGEDLAVAPTPSDAVSMWMQSPGHRENLLRPSFHTVGLGLARGVWSGRAALYVTADFGS